MADLRLKPEGNAPETRAGWTNKLLEYAHQLTVLKVSTYVGGASITTGKDGLVDKVTITAGGKTLLTVCDLIGGDITNVIDERLKDDTTMLEFHATQVEKASGVLPNNIKVLSEFITTLLK